MKVTKWKSKKMQTLEMQQKSCGLTSFWRWLALTPDNQSEREAAAPLVTEQQRPRMKTHSKHFILVTFVSLSLLRFSYEVEAASEKFQATVYNTVDNNITMCHDGFLSVYVSKEQFAGLPFTIYVQGKSDNEFKCVFVKILIVSTFTHRSARNILPSHRYRKTMQLLPWRKWHLNNLNGCFQWVFCKTTGKLESLVILYVFISISNSCPFLYFVVMFIRNISQVWLLSLWLLQTMAELKLSKKCIWYVRGKFKVITLNKELNMLSQSFV